jgi:dephospho-CoA kinase
MSKKIILGITGEMASGKDTVTKYLVEKYSAKQFRFSDPLRSILDRLHLPQTRKHLSDLSHYIRQAFGEDILAHVIESDAKEDKHALVVIDGIRRLSDIDLVRRLPEFTLVYVEADMERRYERLTARRQNADDPTKTFDEFKQDHLLETEISVPPLRVDARFIINNDGTLKELYVQVDKTMEALQKESE